MFRTNAFLSPSHYAVNWSIPEEHQRNELAATNTLGRAYAEAPDSAEKEAMLLGLIEAFHAYLMKYLVMIVRGTTPAGDSAAGRESRHMLRTLVSRGSAASTESLDATCKMLHLAFQGQTGGRYFDEIYDTLVFCFMKAARKFDPHYAAKTKEVCDVIEGLAGKITLEQLNARVDFDCHRILGALVRKGFLSSITGKKK